MTVLREVLLMLLFLASIMLSWTVIGLVEEPLNKWRSRRASR